MSLAARDQLVFIFTELTLDHLFYQVNGYVHVIACLLGTNDIALHRDRDLDLLPFLLHTERYDDFRFRSEIPFEFFEFLFNCAFQSRCYFNVFSTDNKFHADQLLYSY